MMWLLASYTTLLCNVVDQLSDTMISAFLSDLPHADVSKADFCTDRFEFDNKFAR